MFNILQGIHSVSAEVGIHCLVPVGVSTAFPPCCVTCWRLKIPLPPRKCFVNERQMFSYKKYNSIREFTYNLGSVESFTALKGLVLSAERGANLAGSAH